MNEFLAVSIAPLAAGLLGALAYFNARRSVKREDEKPEAPSTSDFAIGEANPLLSIDLHLATTTGAKTKTTHWAHVPLGTVEVTQR